MSSSSHNNRRSNRSFVNASSSASNLTHSNDSQAQSSLIQPSTSSGLTSNRPMTRSFVKQQQQQQQQQSSSIPIPPLQSSLTSLSSLSSSNSSLNSMDTTSLNQQDSKLNLMASMDKNNLLSQLNQDRFKFGKNKFDFEFKEEEKTYQKILTNEKPINFINLIENSRLNGRMISNISNLPNPSLTFLTQRLKSHDYPLLIKRLDQSSITLNLRNGTQEVDDLIQILRDIEFRLVNYNPNALDPENGNEDDNLMREEFEVETINVESAIVFRQYGGIEIFKRILLLSILVTDQKIETNIDINTLDSLLVLDNNLKSKVNQNDLNKQFKNENNFKQIEQSRPQFLFNNNNNNNNNTNNYNPYINFNNNNKLNFSSNNFINNFENKNSISNNNNNNNGFEKCFILKIKCKVIHILNRLICLPHFGKLLVYDLLQYKPINTNQQTNSTTNNNSNTKSQTQNDYDTTLLQYLFSLLMFKESRLQACQLIESILLHIPMLNLNRIQNLKLILENIDDDGLSCICKIFAVTLSNLDMADKKYLSTGRRIQHQQQQQQQQLPLQSQNSQIIQNLQSQNSSKPDSNISTSSSQASLSIRDQNQEFLLNIPILLCRLVKLVRRKDYTVRFNGANNEIEHWIRYIDEALSDSDDTENESMDTTSSNLNNLENQLNQPALLAAAKLNNFVYVLYTLSLLLIGKEKKRVQKSLTKLRLASALNSLFDYLIWNCRCEYPNSNQDNQQQMRSHICPEVAVKIQFLRLVHSFCDHSEFKRVILSKDETEEILKYNQEAHSCLQINESILKVVNRVRCTKESVGLLSKIVQVIKKEPFSASFRFWLIRAIESYLRGGTSYAEQLFLINRGIVEDTIQNILVVNFTRPKEVTQSCFDMLGELIKFNTKGFEILNEQLTENDKFNLLLTTINQSLIDSNMFLRSIFLSIDFIEHNSEVLNYKISSNRILSYFDLFERRILFLSRMMNIINIHNLSQENISCLNTTLIVLMLANRRNILPKYLKAIKSKSIEMLLTSDFIHVNRETTISSSSTSQRNLSSSQSSSSSSNNHPIDLISNFKDLLLFWQTHYLQKDKDCAGLEQNSKIEFGYWKQTVEILLSSNHTNECSLNFYLQNDYINMNNSRNNSIDDYRSD